MHLIFQLILRLYIVEMLNFLLFVARIRTYYEAIVRREPMKITVDSGDENIYTEVQVPLRLSQPAVVQLQILLDYHCLSWILIQTRNTNTAGRIRSYGCIAAHLPACHKCRCEYKHQISWKLPAIPRPEYRGKYARTASVTS